MKLSVVFSFVTIVVLFQFVYADVKPITLTEVEKNSDVQLKPETVVGEKLLRLPRTSWKKQRYGGSGGGCTSGCGGYVAPQPPSTCNSCQGGRQVYGGGPAISYSESQSSASSSSGSWGNGKKK
ncbi:uncharacterized protein LOC123305945 [Chrysoperla carnea]|uniref:uncharacterized protein LOC123305945 n=1 Tax=Chrysoperla carnea TaxID=189513 RepID=UPI001D06310B|nr:uncharacterized protein LOC123305945 [Chrysoperla carnea]